MSKLSEYRQLEKHLAEQLEALEALKGDAGLKKEIEFETKLRDLLAKYGFSLKDVVNLLDPKSVRRGAGAGAGAAADAPKAGTRRAREVKIYEHPKTGERVETKGGNHKILKQWKSEHGSATVESWLKK